MSPSMTPSKVDVFCKSSSESYTFEGKFLKTHGEVNIFQNSKKYIETKDHNRILEKVNKMNMQKLF